MKQVMDIERLLWWAYQDQAVDRVVAAGLRQALPQGVRSSTAAILRHERLGCKIDCSGSSAYAAREVHPDAEAAHDAVMRLDPVARGLVVTHAKCGDRPDAMEGEAPRLGPVVNQRGKIKVERNSDGDAVLCYVTWDLAPENIDFARGIYAAWWDALAWVADDLADRLDDYLVTGPQAAQCPWDNQGG